MSENQLTNEPMLCGHCGNKLPLKIQGKVEHESHPDPDGLTDLQIVWQVLICPTCEHETILKHIWFSEWDEYEYEDDDIIPSYRIPGIKYEILYPISKRTFNHLPKTVARSYEIALHVLPIEPIAFAVFIGRTLESLCADQHAKGKNLQDQIKDLAAKGIIPSTLADMADRLRHIRNVGVHTNELEDISREDALLLRELCEAILEYVYEAPAMLKQVEERFAAVMPKTPPNGSNK